MLQKILSTIMELPYPLALAEARNNKIKNTFVKLNGGVVFIGEINEEGIYFSEKDNPGLNNFLKNDSVKSLELIIPEPGLYQGEENSDLYEIERIPFRKWYKSLNVECFRSNESNFGFKYHKLNHKKFTIDENGYVYFLTLSNCVGIYEKEKIICTNLDFYQELLDWINKEHPTWSLHYQNSTDIKPLKNTTDCIKPIPSIYMDGLNNFITAISEHDF